VPTVHVKVVGSGDGEFRSGDTDFRGVFVGEDVVGQATVIAKLDDAYAFHRGETLFQPGRMVQQAQQQEGGQLEPQLEHKPGQTKFRALENLDRSNEMSRQRNRQYLDDLYKNKAQGVEVQKAK
jgi:hypothetical protein